MNSIIGYILSGVGLAVIVASQKITTFISKFITVKLPIIIIAGAGLILAGIIILMNSSRENNRVNQAAEEVPIYQGEGKNRKIVGYRKA